MSIWRHLRSSHRTDSDADWHPSPEQLVSFFDNVLTSCDHDTIELHIVLCAQCLANVELLAEADTILDGSAPLQLSPPYSEGAVIPRGLYQRSKWFSRICDLWRALHVH